MTEPWLLWFAGAVFTVICALFAYGLNRTNKGNEDSVNGVGSRVADVEIEIAAAVSKVGNLSERVAGLEATVRELPKNSDITALREDLHSVNNSLGRLEGKMEGSQKQIEQMYQVVLNGAKP